MWGVGVRCFGVWGGLGLGCCGGRSGESGGVYVLKKVSLCLRCMAVSCIFI